MESNINQIDRVIFQIRFPAVLEIDKRINEFQNELYAEYPNYQRTQSLPIGLETVPVFPDHIFYTDDRTWSVTLSVCAMSLTCSKYTDWDEFRAKLHQIIDIFVNLFNVRKCNRIGLRYINAIRPSAVGLDGPLDAVNAKYIDAIESNFQSPMNVNLTLNYKLTENISGRTVLTDILFNDGEKGILIDDDVFVESLQPIEELKTVANEINTQSLEVFKKMTSEKLQKEVI